MTLKGIICFGPTTDQSYFENQTNFDTANAAPIDGVTISVTYNDGTEIGKTLWDAPRNRVMGDLSSALGSFVTRNANEILLERDNKFHWTTAKSYNGWGKLRYNFLRVQVASSAQSVIDIFSTDFSSVQEKLFLIGEFATRASLYGLFLDVEGYNNLWTAALLPQFSKYSFADYFTRYYEWGYATALSWRARNPNLNVMFSSGYEGYVNRKFGSNAADKDNEFGLFVPFLDGFIDAWGDYQTDSNSAGTGKITLTTETSYGERDPSTIVFYPYYQVSNNPLHQPVDLVGFGGNSAYFGDATIMDFGLALWPTKDPFNVTHPSSRGNYWTPAVLGSQLQIVANYATWCWLYSPDYSFYNCDTQLPTLYQDQIRTVRANENLPE